MLKSPPAEVMIAYVAAAVFWFLALTAIFGMSRCNPKALRFKERMLPNWRPALLIALLYLAGAFISKGWSLQSIWNVVGGVGIFCQAWLGITLARSLVNYEPLPVIKACQASNHPWRKTGMMLATALLFVLPALLAGTIGLSICRSLLGEVYHPAAALHVLLPNKWLAFFAFFSGAGIAEETTYRLVFLSLIWRWTQKRWAAIILAAALFGAYHLSPLDSMYRTFWQFPISQLVSSSLIGIVWGYLYTKRGYETVVLAHTCSDWLPLMVLMR